MKVFILLIFMSPLAYAIECPEGYVSQITYNTCMPVPGMVCATWYSKEECVPEEKELSCCLCEEDLEYL